jgi:hypothetical protein
MNAKVKLVAVAAGFALLATSVSAVAAESRQHRHFANKPVYHPTRYAAIGDWRHRNARGWDHSCLNVPWLSNMFACSAK